MEINIETFSLKNVGFVVPTLGKRKEFLTECLNSIRSAGCENVILVGPSYALSQLVEIDGLYSFILNDPGTGLPDAINAGVAAFAEHVIYVGWLGDDDLLEQESLLASIQVFKEKNNVVATYGACTYINDTGNELFLNRSGNWASRFMLLLPNLIPQPGSVFLRSAFEAVGGLKPTYPLSFDFELFFNLKKIGKLNYIPRIQGYFRWHPDSMSVDLRRLAVRQTSSIRKEFLPKFLKNISFLWEPLIILVTLIIGKILHAKSKNHK